MNLFGKNKKDEGENSSSPVVSEKTKSSASFLKKTVSKIGGLFQSKKIGEDLTAEPMSNAEYLGEIYKLMVQNHDDVKLERQQTDNRREEEDSEDQKRHSEIIKALTLRRRPKPKRVIRRERKVEEQAKVPPAPSMPGKPGKPGKPSAPSKPSQPPSKPTETKPTQPSQPTQAPKTVETKPTQPSKPAEPVKPAQKPVETKPAQKPAETKPAEPAKPAQKPAETKPAKPAQKPAETKPAEPTKPKTAEPVKEAPKQPPAKPAETVKPPEPVKPPTATQKPPTTKSKPDVSTAEKIGTGLAIATTAALTGKEALAANIAKYESKGSSGKSFGGNEYNAYNKGTSGNKMIGADKPINFSEMTIKEYLRRGSLKSGDPDKLFAVGRYQIIPKTMRGLVKNLKIDPNITYLDPSTQDLLFAKGLTTSVGGRAAIDNYIKGKPGATREAAIMALAQEFASVGVPYDTKRGDVVIKKGQSYYSGLGGNKAHNSPEEVGAALDVDRAKYLKLSPTPQNIGNQIEQSSKDNKDMKSQEKSSPPPIQQNTTNVNNTTESSSAPAVNDRPKHDRK